MTFYVGQKVVCVDDEPRAFKGFSGSALPITRGHIYTVAALSQDALSGGATLLLVECRTKGTGFYRDRFRPAVDPQIEELRAIVREVFDKKPERVKETTP